MSKEENCKFSNKNKFKILLAPIPMNPKSLPSSIDHSRSATIGGSDSKAKAISQVPEITNLSS